MLYKNSSVVCNKKRIDYQINSLKKVEIIILHIVYWCSAHQVCIIQFQQNFFKVLSSKILVYLKKNRNELTRISKIQNKNFFVKC